MRTHATFEEIRHVSLRWFLPPLLFIGACVAGVFLLSAHQQRVLEREAAVAAPVRALATPAQATPAPEPARDNTSGSVEVEHVQAF